MVEAHIFSPQDYVGAIMDLCQDRRGEYKEMTYLAADRVDLKYILPLNEIMLFRSHVRNFVENGVSEAVTTSLRSTAITR